MKGIKVSDYIRPISSNDTYPTHLDIFGKGGLHSVATIVDRDAIKQARRSQGMLVFVIEDKNFYSLIKGVDNQSWTKIFGLDDNNLSFDIFCPQNYILLGDKNSLAKPSPILLDIRQDIVDLRRNLDELEKLDKLDYNYLWLGNYLNEPEQKLKIGVVNLPALGAAQFPLPFGIESIPLPNPTFSPTSPLAYIMSGAWLPQIYAGNPGRLDYTQTETIISSSLAMTQIRVAQALKRIDHGGMIVKSKNISFLWENPAANLIPEAVAQLYDYGTTYTFGKAQALDELAPGILKQASSIIDNTKASGTLIVAVAGQDYVDITANTDNCKIALIKPAPAGGGVDNQKLVARSTIELKDIAPADATYILKTANDKLTNAQALSTLGGGILKTTATSNGAISIARGGSTPVTDDYVDPLSLQTQITETKAFATAEAAAAEAAAIAAGIAHFTEQMLPYSLIPLVPVGASISAAIAVVAVEAKAAQSSADTANNRINNLTVNLIGDVIGTNSISDRIVTVFTPNPCFTGKEYIKIPVGKTIERPRNPSVGMVRYNTEL